MIRRNMESKWKPWNVDKTKYRLLVENRCLDFNLPATSTIFSIFVFFVFSCEFIFPPMCLLFLFLVSGVC